MKEFLHLLKYDTILLNRNKIFTVSAVISAIYVGVFKGLSTFGNVEKVLVLIIFNDPALLGFLFVGVMFLFEKNENTLEVLAVSPIKVSNYMLSKTVALTAVSLICCFAIAFACYGTSFNFIHFTFATLFSTFTFTMLGYIAVAGQETFNKYMLRAIGIILLLSVPFLGYFGIFPRSWFSIFPTQPAIALYQISFNNELTINQVTISYVLCLVWSVVTFVWAKQRIKKNLK